MRIFFFRWFKFILYFWCITLLLSIFLAAIYNAVEYKDHYGITSRDRHLAIFKDDRLVGYLVGSMHLGFTESEMESVFVNTGIADYLENTNKLFLEAHVGHWSMMSQGLERLLLQKIEQQKMNNTVDYLESLNSQIIMLNSRVLFGSKLYYIPYGDLYKNHPTIASFFNNINKIIFAPINIIYQNFINTNFLSKLQQQSAIDMQNMRMEFLEGKTCIISSENIESLRIISRDKAMYSKIKELTNNFSDDEKFMAVIGSAHLSVDDGIISLFEADGFEVRIA